MLLVTLDTTRADHLGPYGYSRTRTPTLNRLASEGTVFERAYSPAPETLPAHSALMTGLYPPSHGVRINLNFRLPPEATTLAEIFRDRGFETAAITAASVLDQQYGLDQGFEVYRDPPHGQGLQELPAEEITRRALDWARQVGDRPFFAWVHYYDPHSPFEPRSPFEAAEGTPPESLELYDLEIDYMDHWLGRLLDGFDAEGLLDGTLIVVAGDHGESLGEHGETYHTLFVYDATQHVPLLFKGPRIPAGHRETSMVSLVDVFATVLALFDIDGPEETSAITLPGLGLPSVETDGPPRGIYSETMAPPLRHGWAALQAVRWGNWLYIRAPREELYDLVSDPGQLNNLASTEEERLREIRRVLGFELRAMPDLGLEEAAGFQPGEAEKERLESLGYLSASRDDAIDDAMEGSDPKDMVDVAEAYQLARLAVRLGRQQTARELLEFVVGIDPMNAGAWHLYAEVLFGMGEYEAAKRGIETALEHQPSNWRSLLVLAAVEQRMGRSGAAEWHLSLALNKTPVPAEVWRQIGRLRLSMHDWERARSAYEKILELRPGDHRAAFVIERLKLGELEAFGETDIEVLGRGLGPG